MEELRKISLVSMLGFLGLAILFHFLNYREGTLFFYGVAITNLFYFVVFGNKKGSEE